jgi:aspartyl aminopeptidase
MTNTKMLSADVTAPLDPSFMGVHDVQTAAVLGKGIVLTKIYWKWWKI